MRRLAAFGELEPRLRPSAQVQAIMLFSDAPLFLGAFSIRLRLAVLASAAILSFAAQAQEAPTEAYRLDPIILRSAAIPAPSEASALPPEAPGGQVATGVSLGVLGARDAMSSPFSATGYASSLAERQNARAVSDLTINDASVATTFPRQSYREVFRIRGFNYITYNMLFMGLPGLQPKQRVLTANAERVEVFKGPDGFLNGVVTGGTSVGGSVNIQPKRAEEIPKLSFTLGFVSDGQPSGHLDWGRRFGPAGEYGARVNASLRDGELGVDDQKERLGSLAVALDHRGERHRLSLDAGYQKARMTSPDWVFTLAPGAQAPKAPDGSTNLAESWSWFETEDLYAVLSGELDLSENWTAYAKSGFSRTETDGIYAAPTALQENGDYTITGRSFPSGGRHFSGEAGLRGRIETGPLRHDLVLAASLWDQRLKAGFGTLGVAGASNIHDPRPLAGPAAGAGVFLDDILHDTVRHEFSSLSFADTVSLAEDRLLLTLGGRWQQIDSKAFNGSTGAQTSHYDDARFTPAFGAVWRLAPEWSLYGNYAESLAQGGTAPATAANAGEMLAPTVSRQIEAGVKFDRGSWGGALSLFEIRQANAVTDLATNLYAADGLQRNRGLELSAYGEIREGLRLLGGVTLLDAEQVRTQGGANDGRTAIGVPDWQAVVGLEWDVPQVPGLTLSGRVIHTDGQYVDAANTQAIPDWTRLDLGAAYAWERSGAPPVIWRATLENALGAEYWASASTGQVTGIARGAPRTLLLSAQIDF